MDNIAKVKTEDTSVNRGGRPRNRELQERLTQTAIAVIAESGFSGLTVDAICARAGVHKTTFYRRWANADEAGIEALRTHYRDAAFEDTGDLPADLVRYLARQVELNSDPLGGACKKFFLAEASVRPKLATALSEITLNLRATNIQRLSGALQRQGSTRHLDAEVILITLTGVAFNLTSIGWSLTADQISALIAALLRPAPIA
jgi:AcrR family transcriptional regulator